MIRNGIDWEGMGLYDRSRYQKIRRVLEDELVETKYNIEYSSEYRPAIEYDESVLNDRLRFGIGTKKSHTFEEIAQMVDVSRERIRQIMLKSLRKIRHPKRVKLLRGFENGHSWGFYNKF